MNTAELINRLLDRADGSLDQLKLHYGPLIRYVITPILPDERDREEVFSDILIRVWDRVDQYDPRIGSWTSRKGISGMFHSLRHPSIKEAINEPYSEGRSTLLSP